ncbi:MAG: mechanosensitive ion channel [Deltaproteobacteria bacterium]|jgi:small-conductance mechanosensitive channel
MHDFMNVWLKPAIILVGATFFALMAHYLIFRIAGSAARRTASILDNALVDHLRGPIRILLPLLAIIIAIPELPLKADLLSWIRHLLGLCLIGCFAWGIIALFSVARDVISAKYRVDVRDNLAAREMATRINMLHRIVVIIVAGFAVSAMLMSFPSLRHLGTSLLASAGVAGIVIGMAARPALSNLIAGIQLAFTQPIRIDDVVIVEGEWGWIEEIRTTYVVVRIWDLRRLVLPLTYFIEKPFQNWTRVTADLLGTVYLYVDYTLPVEEVRQELKRVLDSTDMWDKKVWGLQVTDATDRTMQMRALMSAPDSGTAWTLRCYVREKLITFLQTRYPGSLPKARAEISGVSMPQGRPEA